MFIIRDNKQILQEVTGVFSHRNLKSKSGLTKQQMDKYSDIHQWLYNKQQKKTKVTMYNDGGITLITPELCF